MVVGVSWLRSPARARGIILAAAVAAAFTRTATADVILQNQAFTIGGIPGTALTGFQEFDPSLGTLESVDVQIAGTLNFSATIPQFSALAPVVDFNTQRLTGQGFQFTGARFFFSSLTNGSSAPATFPFTTDFTVDFSVTELTDLTGVIVAGTNATGGASLQPPATVVAQRDDFIEGIVPLGIQEQFLFIPVNFTPAGIFTGGGSVTLTYDYTPAAVIAMPAPGAAALFGFGLAGVVFLRRRPSA
jgi:hypothetical protein